jgi:hypothetical protein
MSPCGGCGGVSARALLRWQFRLAHELLDAAVDGLTLEAVHRQPRGAAAPAGACYAQVVLCEDLTVNGALAGGTPLALSTRAGRTGLSELPPLVGSTEWGAWARRVRLDRAELRAYARAVYASTDAYLAALPDGALGPARRETPACLLNALLMTLSMRRGEIAAQMDQGAHASRGSPRVWLAGADGGSARARRRRDAYRNEGGRQVENEKTRELVQAYYDSWKDGMASYDEERLRDILAPDLRFEGPIAGKREGREPFLVGLADFVRALKAHRIVRQMHAGDEASALYDCNVGASAGTIRFAEFVRVENDRIQEITLLYDANEFRRLMAPVS